MDRRTFLATVGAATAGSVFAAGGDGGARTERRPETALLWDRLTVDDFAEAVKKAEGVVLVPVGCLEKHAHHLPLYTDSIVAHEICVRAARRTPAVVFPASPFGMVEEVKHMKGTMSISNRVMFELFGEMCDEFARNGLKKIVFVNDHGGNNFFLSAFLKSRLEKRHDYVAYSWFKHLTPVQKKAFEARLGPKGIPDLGHADIIESSEMLALAPETVHMDRINPGEWKSLDRLDCYREAEVQTSVDWYARHPTHFAGDPTGATAEHGEWLLDTFADTLVQTIGKIKQDKLTPQFLGEYYSALENPGC